MRAGKSLAHNVNGFGRKLAQLERITAIDKITRLWRNKIKFFGELHVLEEAIQQPSHLLDQSEISNKELYGFMD
jgi:hypothetical protein